MNKMLKRFLAVSMSLCLVAPSIPAWNLKVNADGKKVTVEEIGDKTGNSEFLEQDSTFQYSVTTKNFVGYLWVPQQAQNIDGVLISRINLSEPRMVESKTIRDTCAKNNIAIVYFFPYNTVEEKATDYSNQFNYLEGRAGEKIDELMSQLAATSGFDELRYAPFITATHSTALGMARKTGSWDPNRVIAQVALKGGGTSAGGVGDVIPGSNNDTEPGVPTYLACGQFTEHRGQEGRDSYMDPEIAKGISGFRAKGADRLVTMSVEWEAGHYDWSTKSSEALAEYIDKACKYRLKANANNFDIGGKLKEDYQLVDLVANQTGYVASPDMFGYYQESGKVNPQIQGDVKTVSLEDQKNCYWFFDKEQFEYMRDFTAERKTLKQTENPGDNDTTIKEISMVAADDTTYVSNTGYTDYYNGNECHFIRLEDNGTYHAIALGFDVSKLQAGTVTAGAVSLQMTFKAGLLPKAKISVYTANPFNGNAVAENTQVIDTAITATELKTTAAGGNINIQIGSYADLIKYAVNDKIYLKVEAIEKTDGCDYYSIRSTGIVDTQKPRLTVEYQGPEIDGEGPSESDELVTNYSMIHQYLAVENKKTKDTIQAAYDNFKINYNGLNTEDYAPADYGIVNDPSSFSIVAMKMKKIPDNYAGGGGTTTNYDGYNGSTETPAYIVPIMAPIQWIGVNKETTNNPDVATSWRNYMRWKNNRVFYRKAAQDSYMDIVSNQHDNYAYSVAGFGISPSIVVDGRNQQIEMEKPKNVTADGSGNFSSFTITPKSSAATKDQPIPVDLMVEYGPAKAVANMDSNGNYIYDESGNLTYTIKPDQVPVNAEYPIEVKLVGTQWGIAKGSNTEKLNTADAVEQVFYINKNGSVVLDKKLSKGNQPLLGKKLLAEGITGFQVKLENTNQAGTIALAQNQESGFTKEKAKELAKKRYDSTDMNYSAEQKKSYAYGYTKDTANGDGYEYIPTDYWSNYPNIWEVTVNKNGFVALSEFTKNKDVGMDLSLINQLELSGISEIIPVVTQPEVSQVTSTPWGADATVVRWRNENGFGYDKVEIKNKDDKVVASVENKTNAYISGVANGEALTVYTVKGSTKSEGIKVTAVVDANRYLIDDFETGSLTDGHKWTENQATAASDHFHSTASTVTGILSKSDENHWLSMSFESPRNLNQVPVKTKLPMNLNKKVTGLSVRVKQEKATLTSEANQQFGYFKDGRQFRIVLEGSKPDGTKVTGSYDAGALTSTQWQDIFIPISRFGLGDNLEYINQIHFGMGMAQCTTTAYSIDDISFSSADDFNIYNYAVSKDIDNKVSVSWTSPQTIFDSYRLSVRDTDETKYDFIEPVNLPNTSSSYTLDLPVGTTYDVKLELIKNGQVKTVVSRDIGIYEAGESKKIIVNADSSFSAANKLQLDANDPINMIGRNRVVLLRFPIGELKGNIADAKLTMTRKNAIGGSGPIGIFWMPNNNWIEDKPGEKGPTYLDSYQPDTEKTNTLNSYGIFGSAERKGIFPEYVYAETGNDTLPDKEGQAKVLNSASQGTLKDYYFGNYAENDILTDIDVTATIAAAVQAGKTEVTLFLITPYTLQPTTNLYSKDSTGIKETQMPTLSIATALPTPKDKLKMDEAIVQAYKKQVGGSTISSKLTFPAAEHGSTITWKSNRGDILSDSGIIQTGVTKATDVTLTAFIKNSAWSKTVEILITVAANAEPGDEANAEKKKRFDKDVTLIKSKAAELKDRNYTTSIALPKPANGSKIIWTANPSGIVHVETGTIIQTDADKKVILTGKLTYPETDFQELITFSIDVLKKTSGDYPIISGGGSGQTIKPDKDNSDKPASNSPAVKVAKQTAKTANVVKLTVEKGSKAYYSLDGKTYKKYTKEVVLPVGSHKVRIYTVNAKGVKSKVDQVSVKVNKPMPVKKSLSLQANKSSVIKLKNTACASKITWASTNTKVIKVSKSGKVVAIKAGKAYVKASITIGGKKTIITIPVTIKK